MAARVDAEITVGDTRAALVWRLRDPYGDVVTLNTIAVRMVNAATGEVKINWAAGQIGAFPHTDGGTANAKYQFSSGDVDEEGTYHVQMRDTNGTSVQHWPAGEKYTLLISPVIT